jgi:uncharacterized protein involved in exopolysaccharide biosynthesis
MARKNEQMSIIQAQLDAVRAQIERLRVKEETLVDILRELSGEPVQVSSQPRKRAPSVKPHVLDFMRQVGERGATTYEVDEAIRALNPAVAKDTVGSVLSRLKSEGALVYDGERYYEKKFAPARPSDGALRVVI